VRAGTPEPSPTRGFEENKREEAEAAAAAAAQVAGPVLSTGYKKKNDEELEEGEVEDAIMQE
jgi:hypothetical protein